MVYKTVLLGRTPLALGFPVVGYELGIYVGVKLDLMLFTVIARGSQSEIAIWQSLANKVVWGDGRQEFQQKVHWSGSHGETGAAWGEGHGYLLRCRTIQAVLDARSGHGGIWLAIDEDAHNPRQPVTIEGGSWRTTRASDG